MNLPPFPRPAVPVGGYPHCGAEITPPAAAEPDLDYQIGKLIRDLGELLAKRRAASGAKSHG